MSKEFRTIGINTDPLSVQLYFDENNSIKWKIIFKEGNFDQSQQINLQTQPISVPAIVIQENPILSIFENIYVVGSKNKYQFKYNDIQLQIDEALSNEFEVEYSSFDHLKYNKIIGEDLEKNISWKHYLKTIKKNMDVNLCS